MEEHIDVPYTPERFAAFLEGRITLADLEGVPKEVQYEIAKMGHRYLEEGQLTKAETVYVGLLALDPFDAYFHSVVGSIKHRRGDLERARKHYDRSLELNPYAVDALANRGELNIGQHRYAEALHDLTRAVDLDTEDTPASQRARVLIKVILDRETVASTPQTYS